MKISVQSLKGETVLIEVQTTETIKDIKKKIEQKTGMTPNEQKLIFGDKRLEDDKTVSESTIEDGSIIELLSSDSVKIYVQSLAFEAKKTEKIIDIKKKIAEKIKMAPEEHILFFQGKFLGNNTFVGNYRIIDESVIEVHPKLKNGIVIFVKSTDGVRNTYQVLKTEKISYIKGKIYKKYGIAPDEQILTHQGVILEDDKTFGEYQIEEESAIQISARIGGQIQIFVKTMDGKVFSFDVKKQERIIDLKKRIQEKSGLAQDDQNLYYDGAILENDNSLNYYNIKDQSVINVVARLGGGMEEARLKQQSIEEAPLLR